MNGEGFDKIAIDWAVARQVFGKNRKKRDAFIAILCSWEKCESEEQAVKIGRDVVRLNEQGKLSSFQYQFLEELIAKSLNFI